MKTTVTVEKMLSNIHCRVTNVLLMLSFRGDSFFHAGKASSFSLNSCSTGPSSISTNNFVSAVGVMIWVDRSDGAMDGLLRSSLGTNVKAGFRDAKVTYMGGYSQIGEGMYRKRVSVSQVCKL